MRLSLFFAPTPHSTPHSFFLVQWKIPEDRLCNVAELWMESKTKTARRFTAKNPWWKNDFLEGGRIKFPKRFCMVGTRHFASATNDWYSMWYCDYGRTWSITSLLGWFFAEGERFLSFWRCHRPRKRAALVMWCGWFKPRLEIRHATALTIGAKHWHRQKAVFYVFVSVPPVFIHWTHAFGMFQYQHAMYQRIRNIPKAYPYAIIPLALATLCKDLPLVTGRRVFENVIDDGHFWSISIERRLFWSIFCIFAKI